MICKTNDFTFSERTLTVMTKKPLPVSPNIQIKKVVCFSSPFKKDKERKIGLRLRHGSGPGPGPVLDQDSGQDPHTDINKRTNLNLICLIRVEAMG